jgi:protoporphyrin/coproporphyrin ferrochelatase
VALARRFVSAPLALMTIAYDSVLVVSFGGPEGPADVLPFLENVLRGRNVPRERMLEVAEHYHHFGGKSPINEQNRRLIAELERELADHGLSLPVYWGNRNWHPLLADTVRQMAADGVRRALAFVTSAFSSYSGCRQYREDIIRAQQEVGSLAPHIDKLRVFFNHPGFIEPMIESTRAALEQIPAERRESAQLIFTAHSIPTAMAAGSRYEAQLRETCRLVADGIARRDWELAFQSRSGPPQQPWLGPDVSDVVAKLQEEGSRGSETARTASSSGPVTTDIVVVPIGFVSDHMEVIYDLDFELRSLCDRLELNMVRAATVGAHPRFVRMIRELIEERTTNSAQRLSIGTLGASDDECPADCCPIRRAE